MSIKGLAHPCLDEINKHHAAPHGHKLPGHEDGQKAQRVALCSAHQCPGRQKRLRQRHSRGLVHRFPAVDRENREPTRAARKATGDKGTGLEGVRSVVVRAEPNANADKITEHSKLESARKTRQHTIQAATGGSGGGSGGGATAAAAGSPQNTSPDLPRTLAIVLRNALDEFKGAHAQPPHDPTDRARGCVLQRRFVACHPQRETIREEVSRPGRWHGEAWRGEASEESAYALDATNTGARLQPRFKRVQRMACDRAHQAAKHTERGRVQRAVRRVDCHLKCSFQTGRHESRSRVERRVTASKQRNKEYS